MSDTRRDSARARDEAASWFARLSRRSVTTDSLRDFRDWRRKPANAEAYARVERTWTKAGDLSNDPEIRAATRGALGRRRKPAKALRTLAWAAPVATAALAAAILVPPLLLTQTYDTRTGEQRLVVLEDGSRVRLNTDSRLSVRFTRSERNLTLSKGEAFFEAAHDPSRPFTVDAGKADVRALGTKFGVRRDGANVQVTLLEGSVRVTPDDAPNAVTLAPNQQAVVRAGAVATRAADAARATSWTTGRLLFDRTPLQAAVAEVNRYTPHKLVLDAPGLAERPVSGVFDTGDAEAFVAAVTTLFELKAVRARDGSIVLESRPA